jgi:hypothetical protein
MLPSREYQPQAGAGMYAIALETQLKMYLRMKKASLSAHWRSLP